MGYLHDHYRKLSDSQLKIERQKIEKAIENNDGRLTSDSSADLDYNIDKKVIIDDILVERKGRQE